VIAYPDTAFTAVTNLQEGTYVFVLTVTDNLGATDTDTVTVTVVNAFRYSRYFKIYPNPVASGLHLEYIDDKTGKVKLNIVDAGGQLVLSEEVSKDQSLLNTEINVSQLKPGMYFIQVQQSDGSKLVRPFIKQ